MGDWELGLFSTWQPVSIQRVLDDQVELTRTSVDSRRVDEVREVSMASLLSASTGSEWMRKPWPLLTISEDEDCTVAAGGVDSGVGVLIVTRFLGRSGVMVRALLRVSPSGMNKLGSFGTAGIIETVGAR